MAKMAKKCSTDQRFIWKRNTTYKKHTLVRVFLYYNAVCFLATSTIEKLIRIGIHFGKCCYYYEKSTLVINHE